jgi:2-C-methyl-D-erythritol 4-phosphate cytidylyltransferase / 2-C-methyl-D-erythritol 2,4-cyclodiphosphate synthase
MRIGAVLVAAGSGVRAGAGEPKQFRPLLGRPVLVWSAALLARRVVPGGLVIVAAPEQFDRVAALAPQAVLAPGGQTRTQSVRAGLAALGAVNPDVVLIHDAARPGLTDAVIDRVLEALRLAPAAAPYAPGADSLRQIDAEGRLLACPPREGLVRVQTPQGFTYSAIVDAYAALAAEAEVTDDLEVAHHFGLAARLVPGAQSLQKLTLPEDFAMLEALLSPPAAIARIGAGFDAHRFGPGDHVVLCGVKIPHTAGLLGHSDADAPWHALTDALLGAVGAGDIGDHFPPTDPQWKGAPSRVFLAHARDLVQARGGQIVNVDLTIICEAPRVKPHRAALRQSTAEVLGLALDRVSVKATTTEEMGFTGRREGLAAMANVSVLAP